MDPVTVTALILAIFSALGAIINQLHIKKCSSPCFNSECMEKNDDSKNPSRNGSVHVKTP